MLKFTFIDIDVFSSDGELLSTVPGSSDSFGYYDVGPLPTGDYYILADPNPTAGQMQIEEYYGGSYDIASATLVTVADQAVSGIDIELDQGGMITGAIEDSGGLPLNNIDLDIFDADRNQLTSHNGKTDATGSYTIAGLPSGDYYVLADPNNNTDLADVFYPNALNFKSASLVSVTIGQTTSSINFTLVEGGRIKGYVYDAVTLNTLTDVDMDLYDIDGNLLYETDLTNGSGHSNPGRYNLSVLPPGEYLVSETS